jgi:WhiB family redox-sensing transcriptional regulator
MRMVSLSPAIEAHDNWSAKAACKGLDPSIFYPPTDEEADEAKAVCAACPVQAECLEHALELREKNGVWGGATERERLRIIRRRRRLRQQDVAAAS